MSNDQAPVKRKKVFGSNINSKNLTKPDKWSTGISKQRELECKPLNSKFLPLELIDFDIKNARIYSITLHDLKNGPKLSVFPFNHEARKQFELKVMSYFKDKNNPEATVKKYMEIADLAGSIETSENLIQPVKVYMNKLRFQLNAGHRRTMAHYLLGATHIAAIIGNNNDDRLKRAANQYKENIDRENLSLAEEIRSISKVIVEYETSGNKISRNILSGLVNLKRTKSGDILSVYKVCISNSEFKQLVEKEIIVSLEIAQKLARIKPEVILNSLIKDIYTKPNLTYNQIISKINLAKEKRAKNTAHLLGKKSQGLNITKNINTAPITKIIKLAIQHPDLKEYKKELDAINLESKSGLQAAWDMLYQLFLKSDPNSCGVKNEKSSRG